MSHLKYCMMNFCGFNCYKNTHFNSWLFLLICTYLRRDPFMFVAGDRYHIGPVGWHHNDSSDLGAGDVEGGGAFLVWALDAGATVLIGILAVAEHTLLQWKQKRRTLVGKSGWKQIPLDLQSLFLSLAFSFIDIQGSRECRYGTMAQTVSTCWLWLSVPVKVNIIIPQGQHRKVLACATLVLTIPDPPPKHITLT